MRSMTKQICLILVVFAGVLVFSCQKADNRAEEAPATKSPALQKAGNIPQTYAPEAVRSISLSFEDRVKVMDGLWKARSLQSKNEFEKAFSVFKETLSLIIDLYSTDTSKLQDSEDMEKLISDITDEFVKNGLLEYQFEASELLKKTLPHNFISLTEAYDTAELYLSERNDRQKASDYFEYVVNTCVPEFYKGFNWNADCASAAQYLSLLYKGDERSSAIWERITGENINSDLTVWARRMVYIKQNFAAREPNAFAMYLTASLYDKLNKDLELIAELKNIIEQYPSWEFNPYLYRRMSMVYEEKCFGSGLAAYCEPLIAFSQKYLFEYSDFKLPSDLFQDREKPAVTLVRLGDYLYEGGRFEESITYYRKVVNDYPNDIGSLSEYGLTRLSPIALLNVGMVYEFGLKNYKNAIEVYREVVRDYPKASSYDNYIKNDPAMTARFRIARIYSQNLGDFDSAEKELLEIFEKHGDIAFMDVTDDKDCGSLEVRSKGEALLRLSDLYQRLDRLDEAVGALREILYKYADTRFGVHDKGECGIYGEEAFFRLEDISKKKKGALTAVLKGIIKDYKDSGEASEKEVSLEKTTWEANRTIMNGPRGGRVYLDVSQEWLYLREILNEGKEEEKQVFEIKIPMPVKDISENCSMKHEIRQPFAYLNNVLWVLCSCAETGEFEDETPIHPIVFAGLDLDSGEARLFTREAFPYKRFPKIYRIVSQDSDVVILSMETGLVAYRLEGSAFKRYVAPH